MLNDAKILRRNVQFIGYLLCLLPFLIDFILMLGSKNSIFVGYLVFLRMGSFLSPFLCIVIILWMLWRAFRAKRWLITISIVATIFVFLSLCTFIVKEWRKQALIDSFEYAASKLSGNAKQLSEVYGNNQKKQLDTLINNCSKMQILLLDINYMDRRYDFVLTLNGSVVGYVVLSYKDNQPFLKAYSGDRDMLTKYKNTSHKTGTLNCMYNNKTSRD
jgi:amino acid transporter